MRKNIYIESLMKKVKEGYKFEKDNEELFLYNNYAKSLSFELEEMVIFYMTNEIEIIKRALNKANIKKIKCGFDMSLKAIENMENKGFKLISFEKVKCGKSCGMIKSDFIGCLVFSLEE